MPQVAQQDYIGIITPKDGRGINDDARALAQMAGCFDRKTIFDVLFSDYPELGSIVRAVGIDRKNRYIKYIDTDDSSVMTVMVPYNQTQYEGLSAVQLAIDSSFELMNAMPGLGTSGQKLVESHDTSFICVDGYTLDVEILDGKLTHLSISQDKPDPVNDWVNITWEDAQKLIGLPINQ